MCKSNLLLKYQHLQSVCAAFAMPPRGLIREKTEKKINWNPLCFIYNSSRNAADCSHYDRKSEHKFQLKFTLGLLLS